MKPCAVRVREWRAKNPEKSLAARRRLNVVRRAKRLGVTVQELNQFITGNSPHCEICGSTDKLGVDHDHVTGKLRGILCAGCNLAIGKLGDNLDQLNRAVEYLGKVQYGG